MRTNDPYRNYWIEAVECALDDVGITATDEQIISIAASMETNHECYGMAFGHDCIPNPVVLEKEKLEKDLKYEKEKRPCPECKGKGTITTYGGTFQSTSQCDVCRGEGKAHPNQIYR